MPGPSLKAAAEIMRSFADLESQLATSLQPRVQNIEAPILSSQHYMLQDNIIP